MARSIHGLGALLLVLFASQLDLSAQQQPAFDTVGAGVQLTIPPTAEVEGDSVFVRVHVYAASLSALWILALELGSDVEVVGLLAGIRHARLRCGCRSRSV